MTPEDLRELDKLADEVLYVVLRWGPIVTSAISAAVMFLLAVGAIKE